MWDPSCSVFFCVLLDLVSLRSHALAMLASLGPPKPTQWLLCHHISGLSSKLGVPGRINAGASDVAAATVVNLHRMRPPQQSH